MCAYCRDSLAQVCIGSPIGDYGSIDSEHIVDSETSVQYPSYFTVVRQALHEPDDRQLSLNDVLGDVSKGEDVPLVITFDPDSNLVQNNVEPYIADGTSTQVRELKIALQR